MKPVTRSLSFSNRVPKPELGNQQSQQKVPSPLVRDYVLLWGLLVLAGLLCRPLIPVDETRAVSVAWEMWQRGDFLVPHLNGGTYSHKPPLLQWGIHLGWLLAGVNDWTPRLVAPLFGLGSLFLTAALARRLWPERREAHTLAPLILLSFPVWAVWTTLTLYDLLMACFTLLGLLGLWRCGRGEAWQGRLLTGIAIGGGILSKGPVILLFILPVGLLAPAWLETRPVQGWGNWYPSLLASVLIGAGIALAWAVPAGLAGGEEYRAAIFWGQSAGRIADSFAHRRPWWWYGAILPILLFPWVFRFSLWGDRTLREFAADAGLRFCLLHGAGVAAVLSLVSAKQIHYILPVLPAAALILARLLAESPTRLAALDQRMLGGGLVLLGMALLFLPLVSDAGGEAARIAEAAPLAAKLAIAGIGLVLIFRPPAASGSAVRTTAYALIGLVVAAHGIYRVSNGPRYDMRPMAARLADYQSRGADIAHWGKYSGDFQFLGRLQSPLQVMTDQKELAGWLRGHPDDYVLIVYRARGQRAESLADFTGDYRGSHHRAGLWKASVLSADPSLLASLIHEEKEAASAKGGR